ncbi:death ligand signal enhancer [Gadus macrocephalus]|uniref:death ligand signal enhancer n=1 Tax=Gadus macrocephalus TaxID=80720 RepID=UPI0028CB8C5B|nr:death ligand signal enhancer [Gadus macrocephalus]
MWRLQGFFSRVLHRCHGNAPLRLSQNHCVEDEVVNGSNLLSNSLNTTDSSSQREKDGGKGRKQKTSRFCHTELPRYTALDAVGWGAAAALLMQICRRLHSQWSSGPEAGPGPAGSGLRAWASPAALHKCGYRVLLEILSNPDAFPRAEGGLCMHMLPEGQGQAQPQLHNINRSSRSSEDLEHFSIDSLRSVHQRADLSHDGSIQGAGVPLEVLSGGEGLMEAASTLGHVGHSSVPVILNIIGLDSAQTQHHQQAFPCFAAAARRGYSQAQYNAAVCWETGRGVARDTEKVGAELPLYRPRSGGVQGGTAPYCYPGEEGVRLSAGLKELK